MMLDRKDKTPLLLKRIRSKVYSWKFFNSQTLRNQSFLTDLLKSPDNIRNLLNVHFNQIRNKTFCVLY